MSVGMAVQAHVKDTSHAILIYNIYIDAKNTVYELLSILLLQEAKTAEFFKNNCILHHVFEILLLWALVKQNCHRKKALRMLTNNWIT